MSIFHPGDNIAMKVPTHEFERTVAFYRDVLGFAEIPDAAQASADNVAFEFGGKILWIDRVATVSQAELWLEVRTDDLTAAQEQLSRAECVRRDEIEPLPDDMSGFWIASPSNIIHLVVSEG